MSDQETKAARSKRISKTRSKGVKRYKNAKTVSPAYDMEFNNKFSDRAWYVNCGNSNCVLCGNPRKYFGIKTLSEMSDEEVTALEFRTSSIDTDDCQGC